MADEPDNQYTPGAMNYWGAMQNCWQPGAVHDPDRYHLIRDGYLGRRWWHFWIPDDEAKMRKAGGLLPRKFWRPYNLI